MRPASIARLTPPVHDPRQELSLLQQQLFRRQKQLIDELTAPETPALAAYRRRFERHVQGYERVVAYDEVVREAAAADLVFVGDYHTLRQAQKSYLRLAERLCERGRPPVLGLEFIQARFQPAVDAYLAGTIDEPELLRDVRYAQTQAFDVWPNFRPIFELARAKRLRIAALDRPAGGPRSLEERDAFAARALTRALRPGEPALVLFGQLHLAPPHLPEAVRQMAPGLRPLRQLAVYQNCEEIYWQLEERGLEHSAEAVRVGPAAYCLVNSSPLVCQQSYLDWIEATSEGGRPEDSAPSHHFQEAAELLSRFLGLPVSAPLTEVAIHTSGDLSFLAALRSRGRLGAREARALTRRVLARESFCLHGQQAVYLAGFSVNHAAEVAAQFLRHASSEEPSEAPEPRGLVDGFYARTLEQALGFFGSKVLNPRRKAHHAPRLLRQLRQGSPHEREVALLVLAHLRFEHGERVPEVRRAYRLRDPALWGQVTRSLGQIVGDKLYYAMLRGRIAKGAIRDVFLDPLDEEGAALHTYLYLVGRVGRTRIPLRSA
ncbi:MAG: ChaN family lipoprotein [Deltaproteobacteria bacterium]